MEQHVVLLGILSSFIIYLSLVLLCGGKKKKHPPTSSIVVVSFESEKSSSASPSRYDSSMTRSRTKRAPRPRGSGNKKKRPAVDPSATSESNFGDTTASATVRKPTKPKPAKPDGNRKAAVKKKRQRRPGKTVNDDYQDPFDSSYDTFEIVPDELFEEKSAQKVKLKSKSARVPKKTRKPIDKDYQDPWNSDYDTLKIPDMFDKKPRQRVKCKKSDDSAGDTLKLSVQSRRKAKKKKR